MEAPTTNAKESPPTAKERDTQTRNIQHRSASTPRSRGNKREEKIPRKGSRDRSKSVGPGMRRLKFEKVASPKSAERKKKKSNALKPKTKGLSPHKGFKLSSNMLMVPGTSAEKAEDKGTKPKSRGKMEIDEDIKEGVAGRS